MTKASTNATVRFLKLPGAAMPPGLTTYYLRRAGADGTGAHIKSGTVYLVNVPALLHRLDVESSVPIGAADPLQGREGGRACEF